MNIHIRLASPDDLPILTNIAYDAFLDTPLYEHFSPYRYEHPATFRRFLRNELRLRMVTPGQVIVVAEMPKIATDAELARRGNTGVEKMEVVGYSVWIRRRAKIVADWNPDTLLKRFQRTMLALEEGITSFFSPDHTTCVSAIEIFHTAAAKILNEAGVGPHIELNTLAVHPGRQRMGIGGRLMEWGMDKARTEDWDVVLEATEAGVGLYERMGFDRIGNVTMMGTKLERRSIDKVVLPVMLWRPKARRLEKDDSD